MTLNKILSVFVQNDIQYWQDYVLADLSNTVHSCSRHGVITDGLSLNSRQRQNFLQYIYSAKNHIYISRHTGRS
jgi:hypothetical protein